MSAHPWSHHPIGHVSFAASQGDATISSMLLIALLVAVGGAGIGLIVVCVRALAAKRQQVPIVPPLPRKTRVAPTVPMRTPVVHAARTMRTPVGPSRPGVAVTLVELGDYPGAEPVVPFEPGAARAVETERQGSA